MMFDIKSKNATQFISHDEIISSLEYAKEIKNSREQIENILAKASECKGLTHREAIALLECDMEDMTEKIYSLAAEIKSKYYGNRVVMFAPLYLSNYCINGCVYCPYNNQNKTISRKKLTQEEIQNEVIALQEMGHKRIALETGEHPKLCSIDYVLESIKTIYATKYRNGAIRRVNVNIAATTVENYRKLKDAEIGTYILFQETYHKQNYEALHPTGPKSNYTYHTEAMDRAMEAGIDDVGLGVLFGLNSYKYDFVGLMMHTEHLEAVYSFGAHTISVPRICPADGVDSEGFSNGISDDIFAKIVAIIRLAQPFAGIIVSTRESQEVRERVLKLGVSQISGGSSTKVGGYATEKEGNSAQFELSDTRTLDEIVTSLATAGYIPSFCTACYREGRTGDRFHTLIRNGQIANCCTPNALITFKEYLEDYGSKESREVGDKIIAGSLQYIKSEKVRNIALSNLEAICNGERDFRF